MSLPLDNIRRQVCKLAAETGSFIQKQGQKLTASDVEIKSKNNFVTYVDRASERRLVKGLHKILPEAGFITEEKTISNQRKKYTWIIDPLDGTTNFIHGLPCYCISIGLLMSPSGGNRASERRLGAQLDRFGRGRTSQGEIILGVIYEPISNEMFYATKNGGAFLNGKKISVTKRKDLKNALLATGFPTYDYTRMEEYIKLFRYFMKNTHGLRRLGSAAMDLAYTACGRVDAFYEYSLNPWDVAAGALIVKEAGGKISDFSGKHDWLFGKEIIASNGHLQKELEKSVKKFF